MFPFPTDDVIYSSINSAKFFEMFSSRTSDEDILTTDSSYVFHRFKYSTVILDKVMTNAGEEAETR